MVAWTGAFTLYSCFTPLFSPKIPPDIPPNREFLESAIGITPKPTWAAVGQGKGLNLVDSGKGVGIPDPVIG